ncbi:MAG TPA: MATE family efflux transporter [Sphingobium sp.]|nr:MATE family efflux transporter [Sphingobium sp.]
MNTGAPLTRRAVFNQAWPIIIGQALVPTVGIVDAAIIGRTGDAVALAAVALGATVVTLIFWAFGFLRMGMTGLTAQAAGASQTEEVQALLLRGLLLGFGLGLIILMLHPLFLGPALGLMGAPGAVERAALDFAGARMAGAPAALSVFAINGWLIGLSRTRSALTLQLIMNGANILFNVTLVSGFGLGPLGVGIGTAAAEWTTLVAGLAIVSRHTRLQWRHPAVRALSRLFARDAMARLFSVNADIMVRTLALLALFTWFAHAGARQGAQALAANHVLMQFVSLSAFVLDAFAFTAEARIGAAIGARSPRDYARAVRLTGEFTLAAGVGFSALFLVAGPWLIHFIATDAGVRQLAIAMLPYAVLIPALGAPSWLLDGIFIGATETRAMRNAALIVLVLYFASDWLLRPLGNHGVWLALLGSYGVRALTLMVRLPGLRRRHGLNMEPRSRIFP